MYVTPVPVFASVSVEKITVKHLQDILLSSQGFCLVLCLFKIRLVKNEKVIGETRQIITCCWSPVYGSFAMFIHR